MISNTATESTASVWAKQFATDKAAALPTSSRSSTAEVWARQFTKQAPQAQRSTPKTPATSIQANACMVSVGFNFSPFSARACVDVGSIRKLIARGTVDDLIQAKELIEKLGADHPDAFDLAAEAMLKISSRAA
jgi:hypothetical protein